MRITSTIKKFLLTLIVILSTTSIFATHGQGGDITYEYVSLNVYKVRLTLFRDCHGVNFGSTNTVNIKSASGAFNQNYTLNLVGTAIDITPLCASQTSHCADASSPNDGVQQFLFESTITLPASRNDYIISFSLCCRNNSITTLSNPGSQNIHIQAILNSFIANSSPTFNNSPIAFVCNGQQINYNHGVVDINGDELVFSLVAPLKAAGTSVTYAAGFSGTQPLNTTGAFTIDTSTGAISYIPNGIQTAVVGVKVEEFRLIGGIRTKIGEVLRDMQFSIEDCSVASGGGTANNAPPILSGIDGTATSTGTTGSYTITVTAGIPLSFNLVAYDAITTNLNLIWNNGISGATFTPNGTGTGASFSWTPTINDGGTNFFTVTVKDDNCPLLGINVYTFKIIVIVPVTVTCPSNISEVAVNCTNKQVTYTSAATGSPAPIITYVFTGATTGSGNGDGSGSIFNVGTTTVSLTATDGGGLTANCSFDVTIATTVTFTALADLCIDAGIQTNLGGGTTTGGIYSGPGVTDNGNGTTYSFNPVVAGVGVHTITYTKCTNQATDNVEVFGAVNNTVSQTTPGVLSANQLSASYQWYECPNTLLVGEISQNYTPSVIGDYKVEVTVGSCIVTSTCATVSTLGTDYFDNVTFKYYPNPTLTILNIEYSKIIESVSVVNLIGQQLFKKNTNSTNIQVDLTLFQSGTYFVNIVSEGKIKIIKIVKQ